MEFKTHLGKTVTGERLTNALNKVADDWAKLARAIKKENAYADHVTEEEKIKDLNKMLEMAESIRNGEIKSFSIWQRVNEVLTGECVALLP